MTARPLVRSRHRALDLIEGGAEPRPKLKPWLLLTLGVIVAFFGLIFSRISLDRSAFVLEELETEIATQEARHWDLRLEVARLHDPVRIAAVAEEMGLVFPEERLALDTKVADRRVLDPGYRWAQLEELLRAQP